jgi:hypothetical protein
MSVCRLADGKYRTNNRPCPEDASKAGLSLDHLKQVWRGCIRKTALFCRANMVGTWYHNRTLFLFPTRFSTNSQ